ncbi:hypothetical protein BDC45DRAFT_571764 [Circinella umbellata]|nr:hypothetical protein BDC45DRAFT_571764 [Circinella umbellata]
MASIKCKREYWSTTDQTDSTSAVIAAKSRSHTTTQDIPSNSGSATPIINLSNYTAATSMPLQKMIKLRPAIYDGVGSTTQDRQCYEQFIEVHCRILNVSNNSSSAGNME